eukprot:jgi/Ulvmu1/10663/UM066_0046.1
MDTATHEVPTALLGVGVRTAFYGLLAVTIIGESLRDLRVVTTHQLLNVHRLQCTAYTIFACAAVWEMFLHGWNAFSDRQLICLFALLHTSSLPPFWQHGRPCALLFKSVFPLLRHAEAPSLIGVESSQISISFPSPSKHTPEPDDPPPDEQPDVAPSPPSPGDAPPPEQTPQDSPTAHTALKTIHRGLALWFIAIMALEVAWNIPAIMFWAERFRRACVEPGSEPGVGCEAYAFFLFFRVPAYGWMRWLQLAWYTLECLKSLSLTTRVCAVTGAVWRTGQVPATTESEGGDTADRASCSHSAPEAAAADAAGGAAAPLLPRSAAAPPPPCGLARHWHAAQRRFAAALLDGTAGAAHGAARELTVRRTALKLLLGVVVLTLTVSTVELDLRWNRVQGATGPWDFGQVLAAAAAAAGVVLLAMPGRDAMLSVAEQAYFGGEA